MDEYKTIFLKEFDKYKEHWQIKEVFDESALETVCTRSNLPVTECEDKQCALEKSHHSRSRVTKVEKAIIRRVLED